MQAPGPLFLAANPKHELFSFLTSRDMKIEHLFGTGPLVFVRSH
jgi:hypothetical protein